MTNKVKSTKKVLMAKIHIAKKELNFDDETYRDVLWRVTGKRSCSDMNINELEAVVNDMQNAGFKPKATKKYGKKPNVAKHRQVVLGKIEAILTDMSLPWNYAHRTANNMFGIKRAEWLSDEQLYKLTQALAVYQRRQAKKQTKEQNDEI